MTQAYLSEGIKSGCPVSIVGYEGHVPIVGPYNGENFAGFWTSSDNGPHLYTIELSSKEVEEMLQYTHQDSMADSFKEIQDKLRKKWEECNK
jgi:hypothetical protein